MNKVLVFLFVIIVCSKKVKAGKPISIKHFDVGVNLMPVVETFNDYTDYRILNPAYSAGVVLRFQSKRGPAFTTGVQFTNDCRNSKLLDHYPNLIPVNLSYQPPYWDSLVAKKQLGSSQRFIDLPLIFNFRIAGKKIFYTVNPGIQCNYFLNERRTSKLVFIDGHIEETDYTRTIDNNNFNLYFQFSIGAEKEIADDLFLKVEPLIRTGVSLSFTELEDDDKWLFGLNFSLMKRLF